MRDNLSREKIMLSTFLISGAAPVLILAGVPSSLNTLEVAPFQKKMPYTTRLIDTAERIAKRARCTLPTDETGMVDARIDAAVTFDGEGSVANVVPVSVNCPELEEFVVTYFKKYGKRNGPVSSDSKWYRTALFFRWSS